MATRSILCTHVCTCNANLIGFHAYHAYRKHVRKRLWWATFAHLLVPQTLERGECLIIFKYDVCKLKQGRAMKIASLFQFTICVAMLAHALGFNACMYNSTITLPTCMRVFIWKRMRATNPLWSTAVSSGISAAAWQCMCCVYECVRACVCVWWWWCYCCSAVSRS